MMIWMGAALTADVRWGEVRPGKTLLWPTAKMKEKARLLQLQRRKPRNEAVLEAKHSNEARTPKLKRLAAHGSLACALVMSLLP